MAAPAEGAEAMATTGASTIGVTAAEEQAATAASASETAAEGAAAVAVAAAEGGAVFETLKERRNRLMIMRDRDAAKEASTEGVLAAARTKELAAEAAEANSRKKREKEEKQSSSRRKKQDHCRSRSRSLRVDTGPYVQHGLLWGEVVDISSAPQPSMHGGK